ncbi:MAG: response regulator transcription factor [Firmicutes bacterium]|nr:response regulator transcription factor [Bacillota bacterium]
MKLLIAEDELDLAEALEALFVKNQFTVDVVNDGADAYDYAAGGDYDAVILDVMMPKMNGIEVLKKLRAGGFQTPVMMLTAKGETEDRITGFDSGADDYLPKPFAAEELISRVRALLRRSGGYTDSVLSFGDAKLDTATGMLSGPEGEIRLLGKEFQLMELFMRAPKVLVSADKLMERIWGWDSDSEINVVWVHISNLRKKLSAIGSDVTVKAVRGMGYVLEDGHDKKA